MEDSKDTQSYRKDRKKKRKQKREKRHRTKSGEKSSKNKPKTETKKKLRHLKKAFMKGVSSSTEKAKDAQTKKTESPKKSVPLKKSSSSASLKRSSSSSSLKKSSSSSSLKVLNLKRKSSTRILHLPIKKEDEPQITLHTDDNKATSTRIAKELLNKGKPSIGSPSQWMDKRSNLIDEEGNIKKTQSEDAPNTKPLLSDPAVGKAIAKQEIQNKVGSPSEWTESKMSSIDESECTTGDSKLPDNVD